MLCAVKTCNTLTGVLRNTSALERSPSDIDVDEAASIGSCTSSRHVTVRDPDPSLGES